MNKEQTNVRIWRKRLFITGKVQGVAFRAEAQRQANRLSLRGWVKNLADGRVEIVVEGEALPIKKFIEWCHQGPPRAVVERVDLKNEPIRQGGLLPERFTVKF